MKNILWSSIFILAFLPQTSFGADQTGVGPKSFALRNPSLEAFNNHQNEESQRFFSRQASERGDFIKANPDATSKEERRFKRGLDRQRAQLRGEKVDNLPDPGPQDNTVASFEAHQQAE